MLIPRKIFFLAQAIARAILMAILALTSALPLAAATYTVTNTDDSGAGSLRQAILNANANAGADIIDATGVSGTITINPANYFLVITDDVTILGPGQANLTISGGGASRIFWIQNGTITIQDLTLANGYAKGGNGGGGGMGAGGAIFMHEGKQGTNHTDVASGNINLTLINVTLQDNDAIGGNGGLGNSGGGGMGGNGGITGGVGGGGVLGNGAGYGGSVTDAVGHTSPGDNGGIEIFGKGGTESGVTNSVGGFGGGGEDGHGGFAGGGGGSVHGGGSFGYGGFGGGGGGAGTDINFLNNGGANGGYGGGGGGLQFRGDGSNGDNGGMDGDPGFGGGKGTDVGGGGMGAGGAIFVASGTLTMKSVTFQNNTATGGTGGNDGQGLGGALFIFDKADNGGNAAPGTTNDPQVSGCDLTFSSNTASTSNNDTYGSIGFANICPLILTAEGPAGPLTTGAPATVTIKADKFVNLGTLQFSVNWDETELQLDGNTPLTIDDDAPLIGTPAPNQLTYSWFDADIDYGVTLPDGTTILTLNFTVLAAAPTTGINVDIADTPTIVEATDNNFEIVPVTLNNLVNFDVIAPTAQSFVFVANKVTLKSTKQSTPAGDIHSNGLLIVEKGKPSTYNSNLTAVGKITINKQNTINGNVKSQTSVSNSGTINGTPSVGPVDNEPLPSLTYSAGGANKTVPKGKSLTLTPGSYGIVTMSNNGTLKLTSGEYFFNELRYSSSIEGGKIEINLSSGDPVTINVVTNLQIGHEGAVMLLPNGESDSHLVTFNTKQTTAANWGREAYLLGSFNAPNAVVTLVKNTQLRGSIYAKEILVSNDCLFLHHDSPGSLPGPGNLPKSSFDEEEVASDQSSVISDYALEQNYPNPFNPTTTIGFALPEAGDVSLSIFNTNGQLVKQVASGKLASGRHQIVWDATDDRGQRVASGVYLYVIKAGPSTGSGQAFTAQKKLVLMK